MSEQAYEFLALPHKPLLTEVEQKQLPAWNDTSEAFLKTPVFPSWSLRRQPLRRTRWRSRPTRLR